MRMEVGLEDLKNQVRLPWLQHMQQLQADLFVPLSLTC